MWWALIPSLLSAGGQAFGGMMQEKQSKYASDVADYQARYVDAVKELEIAKLERYKKQTIASQRAQTAASGIRTDVGAPLELEIETEILADIDKNIIRNAGSIEALRYRTASKIGQASGLAQSSASYAGAAGSLLDATMAYGSRAGWFAPANNTAPSYPRNYRTF